MPIAPIPNKVLTLMQTEDKKTGKIVSLQKNLEWSTKEVLGAACWGWWGGGLWNIEGLEMAGRVYGATASWGIHCWEGFRSSSSAAAAAGGVGESVPSHGGSGGGASFAGKGTFSPTEKAQLFTQKRSRK